MESAGSKTRRAGATVHPKRLGGPGVQKVRKNDELYLVSTYTGFRGELLENALGRAVVLERGQLVLKIGVLEVVRHEQSPRSTKDG